MIDSVIGPIAIPNLPGYKKSRDTWSNLRKSGFNLRKSQSMNQFSNVRDSSVDLLKSFDGSRKIIDHDRPLTAARRIGNDFNKFQTSNRPQSASPMLTNTSFGPSDNTPILTRTTSLSRSLPNLPKFVGTDNVVLRFHGHFFQPCSWERDGPIGFPTIEDQVARRLTIIYNVADGTVSMAEDKCPNSGILGGQFFKRGVLLKNDQSRVELLDLTPGNSVRCLGREIFITDADPATREYFRRELGMIPPPSLSRPGIVSEEFGAMYATGLGGNPVSRSNHKFGFRKTSMYRLNKYMETQYEFAQYVGRVLRFNVVEVPPVDIFNPKSKFDVDRFEPTSNSKKLSLSYFIGDKDVELRAPKVDGEDAHIVLKRQKLAKNWKEFQQHRPPVYFEPTDFICGQKVDFFSRILLIIECDKKTKEFYDEIGIQQNDYPVVQIAKPVIVQPIPKMGDGFLPIGKPEDTLATVYGMPKATKSMNSLLRNQNRMLRCNAIKITDNPIDASRIFSVTYMLEDDTIQIFEEVQRNSGITGGTFLKRGKYINDLPSDGAEPRYFKPQDIYIGNVFSVCGNEFQITRMDNMSQLFCEAYPDEFPMFDTFAIVGKLVNQGIAMKINFFDEFAPHDPDDRGFVDEQTMVACLENLGLSKELNDQELMTLIRRFKEGDRYYYIEMGDLFSNSYYKNNLNRRLSFQGESLDDLDQFLHNARGRNTQWRRAMRKDTQTVDGHITLARLVKIFTKYGIKISTRLKSLISKNYSICKTDEKTSQLLSKIEKLVVEDRINEDTMREASRADLRSSMRMQDTFVGSSAESIQTKRSNISKAILRKNQLDRYAQQNLDDDKVVINYQALCNDIYVRDWQN